jgi:hypothetical protein
MEKKNNDTILQDAIDNAQSPSDILNALREIGGDDAVKALLSEAKKTTARSSAEEKAKYVMSKKDNMTDLQHKVEALIEEIFGDSENDESIVVDMRVIRKAGEVSSMTKTRTNRMKQPVVLDSDGKESGNDDFRSFGKRTYKKRNQD